MGGYGLLATGYGAATGYGLWRDAKLKLNFLYVGSRRSRMWSESSRNHPAAAIPESGLRLCGSLALHMQPIN